jgi:hypothetical protein
MLHGQAAQVGTAAVLKGTGQHLFARFCSEAVVVLAQDQQKALHESAALLYVYKQVHLL